MEDEVLFDGSISLAASPVTDVDMKERGKGERQQRKKNEILVRRWVINSHSQRPT